MKKVYLLFAILLSFCLTSFSQEWIVYDCSLLPDESAFGFVTSNVAGEPASNIILDDPADPGNKILQLISPGPDPGKFMWRYNLPNNVNDPITFVIRLKGVSDTLDRTMELDFEQAGFRERLFLKNDNTWELKHTVQTGDLPGNTMDWHIIRITKNVDVFNFYFDENPVPVAGGTTTTISSNNYFRIGDGNGSSTLGGLVDWVVWDTTGAYAPGEGVALPDSLVQDVPAWVVYDADSIPNKSNITFVTSNVAGDPATNTIIADPDNIGNNYLELISPGADPSKFMWRHTLANSVNDQLTLVTRMKGVSDTLNRIMELDLDQGGARERLYVKTDNTWELKESAEKGSLPIGVLGWHIYRMTKIGDSVDVYLDENPVPFVSVISKTASATNNYFRFGDGNGSSTLGGLVDWMIWDTTGAYAPGRGLIIPDSLVKDIASSVSALANLTASTGTLVPGFHADSLLYHLNLEPETESLTLTGTAADEYATVSGDGEFTTFPDTVSIVVTSEDGLKTTYTVNISAVPYIHKWMVYDADSVPDRSNIEFSESNVAGDPATNEILVDPDNAENNLLKLVSPGADPGKFMWKHDFPNSADDSITIVARIKGVTDTLNRVMEFDIQQAGFRERLYLKSDNTFELKENGAKGDLPVGLMGWHIFRITKILDSVNVYIDENTVPFVYGRTRTTSSENYFRFGDGNGSSTLGAFIDWVIWDTTGAFAPGLPSPLIPDSLIVAVSVSEAGLASLVPGLGSLDPVFQSDLLEYNLVLPAGTTSVSFTATANDVLATIEGDDEYTALPVVAEITVKAQDGLARVYAVNITVEPSGIGNAAEKLFRIWPNPASDQISLEFTRDGASIYIYDITGKLVVQKSVTGTTMMMDVSGFSRGVYCVRVVNGKETASEHIIIK